MDGTRTLWGREFMAAAGVCGEVLVADAEDGELEAEVRSKEADLGLVVEGERITADFEIEISFFAARPVPVSLVSTFPLRRIAVL